MYFIAGKKNPNKQWKTLDRKQKLFQGFKYFKQLHNALSHPTNTPQFVIWIYYIYPESWYIVYLSLKADSEVLIPKWTGRLFK